MLFGSGRTRIVDRGARRAAPVQAPSSREIFAFFAGASGWGPPLRPQILASGARIVNDCTSTYTRMVHLGRRNGRQLSRLGNWRNSSHGVRAFPTSQRRGTSGFAFPRLAKNELPYSSGPRSITRTPGGAMKTKRDASGERFVCMLCRERRVVLPRMSTNTVSTICPVSRFARSSSDS